MEEQPKLAHVPITDLREHNTKLGDADDKMRRSV